jgi:hypothetical protein
MSKEAGSLRKSKLIASPEFRIFLASVFHAKILQVITIARKTNWAIVRQFQKFVFKFFSQLVANFVLLAVIAQIAPKTHF